MALSEEARLRIDSTTSTSFACDLRKWLQIMETYESGGHAYHATMPTDALRTFHHAMMETKQIGFDTRKEAQWEQGRAVRAMRESISRSTSSGRLPASSTP